MYTNQPIFSTIWRVNANIIFSEWEQVSFAETAATLETELGSVHGTASAIDALWSGQTVETGNWKFRASGGSVPNLAKEKVWQDASKALAELDDSDFF